MGAGVETRVIQALQDFRNAKAEDDVEKMASAADKFNDLIIK